MATKEGEGTQLTQWLYNEDGTRYRHNEVKAYESFSNEDKCASELFDFCKDHISSFGCMPAEFESSEGKLIELEEFHNYFSVYHSKTLERLIREVSEC